MERVSVSSSNIAAVGYDESTQILEIEFMTGSIYEYYGIPAYVHEEMVCASSIGGYFAQRVKNSYGFSRIG